ncbi:hypothetical protein VTO42DRAFT_1115 [Malbranchea cinnamomea]
MEYERENGRFEGESRYDRDRSASPRGNDRAARNRSMSPNGRASDSRPADNGQPKSSEEDAANPGTNLFVTGIHPRLTESDVARLFEKYGEVQSCSIMVDPHTKESRGFGFVNMQTPEQAEAAKEGLQGEVIEGRTLSIEKARRNRPRTPTPGKYFGPPKRDYRGPPRGGRYDRYDDRRGPYGGRRYDDAPRYGRYDSYGYGGRYRDYGNRGVDRYASAERYGSRGDDRRSDYRRPYYDRDDARAQVSAASTYTEPPPRELREPYAGGPSRYDRYGTR